MDYLAPAETMRITLKHLADTYGGVEAYAREIGLTTQQIQAIRESFVE